VPAAVARFSKHLRREEKNRRGVFEAQLPEKFSYTRASRLFVRMEFEADTIKPDKEGGEGRKNGNQVTSTGGVFPGGRIRRLGKMRTFSKGNRRCPRTKGAQRQEGRKGHRRTKKGGEKKFRGKTRIKVGFKFTS